MAAEPLHADQLGDDPEQILRALPAFCQREFLTAYRAALDAAHQVDQFDRIRRVLHEWRLQAIAFADPAYETAVRAAREGRGSVTPAEQVPGFEHRTTFGDAGLVTFHVNEEAGVLTVIHVVWAG